VFFTHGALRRICEVETLAAMVKFECPFCGQSMQTAQFLNGKGHCLKCDFVVAETEASIESRMDEEDEGQIRCFEHRW
jgi:predicted RNA-binding Zn-ribbon protein involved in translation (DUF1610 family)